MTDISLVFTTILHISLVSTMNLLFMMPPGCPKGSTKIPAENEEAQNRRNQKKSEDRLQAHYLRSFLAQRQQQPNADDTSPTDSEEQHEQNETSVYDGDEYHNGASVEDDEYFVEDDEDEVEQSVMGCYLKKIQTGLHEETSQTCQTCINRWLFDMVKDYDYRIPSYKAQEVCQELGLDFLLQAYYRDIVVWVPDLHWGAIPCPNGCGAPLSSSGWTDHTARSVHDLYGHHFVMSKPYICKECKVAEEREKTRASAEGTSQAKKDQITYTWTGTTKAVLDVLPHNCGSHFPAFLTKKSGLDWKIVDLMRPLLSYGICPTLSEVRVLEKNETWVEVPLSDAETKILPGTWVFYRKRTPDGIVKKHKGQYCCRGDLEEGIFDTTAYVVFWCTVRLFLVLSLTWGWNTCSIDFTSAFVQAKLENPVWIHPPRSFHSTLPGKTCLQLLKSLYGLRVTPHLWSQHLEKALRELGFEPSAIDPCLFIKPGMMLVTYVINCGVSAQVPANINRRLRI